MASRVDHDAFAQLGFHGADGGAGAVVRNRRRRWRRRGCGRGQLVVLVADHRLGLDLLAGNRLVAEGLGDLAAVGLFEVDHLAQQDAPRRRVPRARP